MPTCLFVYFFGCDWLFVWLCVRSICVCDGLLACVIVCLCDRVFVCVLGCNCASLIVCVLDCAFGWLCGRVPVFGFARLCVIARSYFCLVG